MKSPIANTEQASTKQDILQYLLKQGRASAIALADSLDISPQAIRRHLKDLENEELIHHSIEPAAGMGRPQHIYHLSTKGRDRFPDRYNQFAVSFLDTLIETVGEDRVDEVLHKQWQRKGIEYRNLLGNGSLPERLENLVRLRRTEGYVAEWHAIENEDRGIYIFTEYNCAIAHVAESFPSVCGHELEMFGVALNCTVERTHWMVDGEHRCGYLIQAIA
jgi:DeoR family transcriptional regulator, suf operon transcriptional repressor